MFVIITGATATGKSAAAVELAKKINGEIVSADSMQVYRGMDIGTFKATHEEMSGIPHYMIDIIDPGSAFSAAQYKIQAEKIMDDIKSRGRVPVLAGGTGLYIHAVIRGIMKADEPSEKIKAAIRRELADSGLDSLAAALKAKDPEGAAEIDLKNSRRVVRTLELIEANGVKLSVLKAGTGETRYRDDYRMFVLELKRDELYRRINARTDEMIKKGLINEVKSLINKGVNIYGTAMQAIGYKEIITCMMLQEHGYPPPQSTTGLPVGEYEADTRRSHLRQSSDSCGGRMRVGLHNTGGAAVPDEVIDAIKQATRNFAKRQVTWFKKYKEAERVDVTGLSPGETAEIIMQKLKVSSGRADCAVFAALNGIIDIDCGE
jgi:tRNA dimethylallyltransferase